jgi:hypothetical protein
MFKIEDNMVPLSCQVEVKKMLLTDTFPWYYKYGTVFDKDIGMGEHVRKYNSLTSKEIHWFGHKFVDKGEVKSPHFDQLKDNFVIPFMAYGPDNGYRLDRIQANLVPPQASKFEYRHTPWHLDNEDEEHVVLIYYVTDHKAKTLFKNGKSVKPKQGRFVMFDGNTPHGSQIPKRRSAFSKTNWYSGYPPGEMRCVINFNFVKE